MRKTTLGALVVFMGGSLPALAQVRAGGEFQVNTYTTLQQFKPGVVATKDGRFVVMWESNLQDGSDTGVYGQRYDAAGNRVGQEFRANTYTTGPQGFFPDLGLGIDAKGKFVATWPTFGQDGSIFGGFGQRFDAAGTKLGGEFLVNSYTTGLQGTYGADMAPDGRFVVTWIDPREGSSYGIYARRFDASGAAAGEEFLVNAITTGQQTQPDVAIAADGSFVVAFRHHDVPAIEIDARRFDAAGAPLGAQFRVNTYTANQYNPQVAAAPDGGFAVVWSGTGATGVGVFARRFDQGGAPLGPEFQVSTGPGAVVPALAYDAAGRLVVSWTETDGSGSGVHARRFEAGGLPRGAEFLVNTTTTFSQYGPKVASDAVGNFVVTWSADGVDGSYLGVAGQRFGGLLPASLAVDDAAGDDNGVLDPGDAFTLRTAWRNVNGAAQTFQGRSSAVFPTSGLVLTLSPDASYGTVANGAVGTCGAPCFSGTLTGSRPVSGDFDAGFDEDILPDAQGQKHRWRLHVGRSFTDVPGTSPFYRFVETLLHYHVTSGCGGSAYCPLAVTSREQMAVFVLVAKEGAGYAPPACTTPVFDDVPASSPFCRFVEELVRRGVTAGCGGSNYCPTAAVSREQMAVFVLRTLDPALSPPACTTPVFSDVPASSPFCRWIEELARRGVVNGCGGGRYCPLDPVTREQMGVFISATFGLALYGP